MSLVWGGATYPQLRFWDAGLGASRLYLTEGKGLPQVKLTITVEETGLALVRLASREVRRRRSGYLMRFQLHLRLPSNWDLLDFIYESMRKNAPLYIRPHPNDLIWPAGYPYSDEWPVVIDGPFNWDYFNDKWVGHDVVLRLVATQEMTAPPVNAAGPGFLPVVYSPVAGVPTATAETGPCFWGERMMAGAFDFHDGEDDVCFWES